MKWSNFYDRQSNNKTCAANHNLVISSYVDELARAGSRHHAYHLRPGLGRCRYITMATPISKYLRCTSCSSEGWSTRFHSGLDLLLGEPCQCQSVALCPYASHDRDRDSGLLNPGHFSNLTSTVGIFLSLGIWSI